MVIFRTTDDQKVLCWLVSGGAPPLMYGIELGSDGEWTWKNTMLVGIYNYIIVLVYRI